ncbi:DUF5949 family protein [Streptomyces sp. HK10]|uniref:DUF5949 family protein n=1 Tax=Streptomyces sp. HK10 TaxID=3373255 RepID=UPI0037482C12
MNAPLGGRFGQLIMSGWIGTDPRNGDDIAFLYLGTPGNGSLGAPTADAMQAVARELGLNPRPRTMTEKLAADTHVTFTDGWIDLRFPNGEHVQHPGSTELRQVAQRRGELVLMLTYLPMRPAVGVEDHSDQSMNSGQFTLGLVPVH